MIDLQIFRREREYKVVIKFVARANMHHLGQFLAGKRADAPQEALQILDIVLRELSSKRYNFPMLVIMLNFICDQWSSYNSPKIDVKLRVWLPIKHFSYTLQKRVLYTRCNIHIYIYIYFHQWPSYDWFLLSYKACIL